METIVLTEQEVQQVEKETQKPKDLVIQQDGMIEVTTATDLLRSVAAYRKMKIVPKHFETDAEAAGAIVFCKQLGIPPLQGWGQVACIHGKYAAFGSLFTALAQKDPDFGYDEVFYVDENGKKICVENQNLKEPAWACVVRTQKKGSPFINEFVFSMDDAQQAGIIRNVWKTYPKSMLFWKAIARAYRATYPAALNGLQMAEDLKTDWSQEKEAQKIDLNNL